LVIWNNGSGSWDGPLDSGEQLKLSHAWDKSQTKYTVRAKSMDIFGYENGDWASYTVHTPRNHRAYFDLFDRLIEYFPKLSHLFKILFS